MTTADSGEHFPQGVKRLADSAADSSGIPIVDGGLEQIAFYAGVLAVRLDVYFEVGQAVFGIDAVVGAEPFDLRFGDCGDLALIGIEGGETFFHGAVAADRFVGVDQGAGFLPERGVLRCFSGNAHAGGEG